MTVSGRGGCRLVTVVAAALLAACSAQAVRPPSSIIEAVGPIDEQRIYPDKVVYRLENGQVWEAQTGTFRTIMDWGGTLLVAGSDADGRWVATLGPQDGLPETCYFTPERGTEWGDGIAIAGVLFAKAPGFSPDSMPELGSDHRSGRASVLTPRASSHRSFPTDDG